MNSAANNLSMLLIQQKHAIQQARQSLVQGQLLFGQVEKLTDNHNALVRFSSFLAHAKLEVPIQVGAKSWFQVIQNTQPIVLKYLPTLQSNQQGVANLLQTVGSAQPSQQEVEYVNTLFQRQLPVQKTQLQALVQTFKELPLSESIKGSIDFALARQWQPTPAIVQSLQEVLFNSPIHMKLLSLQQDVQFQQHYQQQFNQPFSMQGQLIQVDSLQNVTQLLLQLGLYHERGLRDSLLTSQTMPQGVGGTLKEQLHTLLQLPGLSQALQSKILPVIHHLQGLQLLAQDQQPLGVVQGYYQLPMAWHNEYNTAQFYYKGKQGRKGKIDPYNCRIILMLALPLLKDCLVDVHVHNKQMDIKLYNAHDLSQWSPLLDHFKERIQHLAAKEGIALHEFSIHLRQVEEAVQASSWFSESFTTRSGVDIKV